jgi:hypothetical protein
MLRSGVDQALVEDLVRGVGYGVLKLVTAGTYRSGGNGLFLEGCTGLLVVAAFFYFLYIFVT